MNKGWKLTKKRWEQRERKRVKKRTAARELKEPSRKERKIELAMLKCESFPGKRRKRRTHSEYVIN